MNATPSRANTADSGRVVEIYLWLQFLDFATTAIGLQLGLGETNPFIRGLISVHPVAGVLGAKMCACLLAVYCIYRAKLNFLRYVNGWFAAVVTWNVALLLLRLRS